jgi:hypothetical protein
MERISMFDILPFELHGPWFVRVIENKVPVGVFCCFESELADLIDESTDPHGCEYKLLPSGGFIFGGAPVLHLPHEDESRDAMMEKSYLTEGWYEVYESDGTWNRVYTPDFDNDD